MIQKIKQIKNWPIIGALSVPVVMFIQHPCISHALMGVGLGILTATGCSIRGKNERNRKSA